MNQLLLLSFLIIILVILILIALDVDYLSRLFSHKKKLFLKSSSHSEDVGDINRQINMNVQLKSTIEKLILLCPVNAITKSNEPQESVIITKKQCLGYSCRECLRFVFLEKLDPETEEKGNERGN